MDPYIPPGSSYPETDQYPPPDVELANRYAGGRTPSPTPSEVEALSNNFLNLKKYLNWRFWARKDWIPWYILGVVILVLTILISVFDKQIVNWLTPAGRWMRGLKLGWLIPIAILFVISFPPLFGHEIVAILVGVIWGLGVGFAIVAAGTFIGEIGNFYAFKYCCRARGEKMEKGNITYACLARVVREGGFKVALIIRLSVIPGHFSTAVFSTCGMGILVFALAALLSLPKQFITVYIGVIIEESGTGATTTKDKIISDSVLAVTILITMGAAHYVWQQINRVKPAVIYERRKARQVKMANPAYSTDNNSSTNLYPRNSESELPLSVTPQRPGRFAFNQPTRQDSGNYAGYGGYTPTYAQGRYGESLEVDDERKSTEVVGWETRGARVDDMRGANWGVAASGSKLGHASDDEDESEEGVIAGSASDPVLPPALPLPGDHQSPYPPPASSSALPNPYGKSTEQTPRHTYELSDPPVANHTPLPSDSTYPYPPSLHPSAGYAQTDVLPSHSQGPSSYSHGPESSDASYISQYPLMSAPASAGHAVQPTDASDASFYTAAGALSREPSDMDSEPTRPPNLEAVRTFLPSHNQGQN